MEPALAREVGQARVLGASVLIARSIVLVRQGAIDKALVGRFLTYGLAANQVGLVGEQKGIHQLEGPKPCYMCSLLHDSHIEREHFERVGAVGPHRSKSRFENSRSGRGVAKWWPSVDTMTTQSCWLAIWIEVMRPALASDSSCWREIWPAMGGRIINLTLIKMDG